MAAVLIPKELPGNQPLICAGPAPHHVGLPAYEPRDARRFRANMAPPTMSRMASSSDPAYKLLLAQPRMVEDLVCGFIAPEWCGQLDFPTLTQTNAEYIGTDLHHRIGDMVWRVAFEPASPSGGPPLANGERPYLLLLFECQSTVDPDMAFRMYEYVYLLHRHLRNNGTVKAEGRAPPVLPVVVYNGERPWTAAGARAGPVAAPETAGWIGNEAWAYALLDERERADEGAGLMGSRLPPDNRMTTLIGLEAGPVEARARLLVEAFERYPGEEEKGLREGYHARVRPPGGRYGDVDLPPFEEMERELRARRGGKEMATLMEARTREFEERAIARGREQGITQGIAQGRAEERALLRSLAERRFGAETAARTAELLAGVEDAEGLIEAGGWIVDCRTGEELLERLRHARGT